MSRLFSIIGCGSGQPADLTGQAREVMRQADLLLSTDRLAEGLSSLGEIEICPIGLLAENAVQSEAARVAILVSGDAGFFSAAKSLLKKLAPHGETEVLCGLSSMQLLCARLGTSYEDAMWLSLHGRDGSLIGAVSYHPKVFVLTGGAQNAQKLCRSLVEAGLDEVRVSLGENLGAPGEVITIGTAAELAAQPCGDLAVLLIENTQHGNADAPIFDSDMTRGEVPMTKQEVRWAAVNLLDLRAADVVYDIGAGTGSVSVEMARRARRGMVYAVERTSEGIALIEHNRRALGCFNVQPVEGSAPAALAALPAPDAAFVGGSGGALYEVLSLLKTRNPEVRIVIPAVSLETLSDAQIAMQALEFERVSICQIAAVRGKKAEGSTPLTACNPVFLLSGGVRG